MRSIHISRDWQFGLGRVTPRAESDTLVDLPHDYMILGDVYPEAPSQAASGYYNAGIGHYVKFLDIPAEWENDRIFLRFDGAMMNTTVEVNGDKAALQHFGYAPFEVDITDLVYPGKKNRVVITTNPSMQPNSRWFSGAGIYRDLTLVHTPKLHAAFGGLSGWTEKIEYAQDCTPETAFLKASAVVHNANAENRVAEVWFDLIKDDSGEVVLSRKTAVRVEPMADATAYMTLTVDKPLLWSADDPQLYRLQVRVREIGTYKTHIIPAENPTEDAESVLFGIRTIEYDVRHGLRINGKETKLKGGCLHHDNGVIGAISVYDAEARKVRKLKEVGFNAIRTTHNPPSAALIEACDREGMYVFDEAFDVWGMGKQPGDYNQYFETDWEKDLTAFVCRDRCHPSVVIWSTGNEITERAGLWKGYVWATKLAETIRRLDPSRPVSNATCSFWSGLDDELTAEQRRRWQEAGEAQNAALGGAKDVLWEEYTEAFDNGLDIVGYNYYESKYAQDHELFPERVILGSENYPKEIGVHWPVIRDTPWIIGDFTWTAWDYIGEAGIGKAKFYEPDDEEAKNHSGFISPYPWRTANDSDFDVTGAVRPQGVYRRIVWGSKETALYSYDPAVFGKVEMLSPWSFPSVWPCWNWSDSVGKPVEVVAFSAAEEVELFVNGESAGKLRAGEALSHDIPLTFVFRTVYKPGKLEAVSYVGGKEVSRAVLASTGVPCAVRLTAESESLRAKEDSLCYVRAELVDADGNVVPCAAVPMTAEVTGAATLLGFGSGNPITDENYSKGRFTSYQGKALAVLRGGHDAGEARLTVTAEGVGKAELTIKVL
ncbi:MAG: DUF4982 domain-containing protein [Oscillospiraceae bacterium]|nr:DUF4982 domain-containing protein [Oscillospiraceae bacterium]